MNDEDDIPTLEFADDQPDANALHWTAAEDPEMAQAIQAAQATFTEFARHAELEHFRVVPGFTHIGVKAFFSIPKRPGSGEHMFVEQITTDGKTITGILTSTPHAIPNLHEGQRVTFPVSDLSDWFLVQRDKGLGGFTIDVMKRQMDPDELKQYESQPPLAWYRHRVKLNAKSELARIPVCNQCGHRDLIATSYTDGVCGLCANGAIRTKCPTCSAPLIRNANQPRKCAACLKPEPPTESDSSPLIEPDGGLPLLTVADDEDEIRLSQPLKLAKDHQPLVKTARKSVKSLPLKPVLEPEAPPQRRVWLWGTLGLFAFVALAVFGIRMTGDDIAKRVVDRVRNHPVVFEKLGGIDECKMNFAASLNEGGKRTDVFDVRGPKGSGQFVTFELFYQYRSIKLRTAEGEWELLDGRENGVAQQNPTVPQRAAAPPTPPAMAPSQPAPAAGPRIDANSFQPPSGSSVVNATTPLRPGVPVHAQLGAIWYPAEVLAVRADGSVVVHWPHLPHEFNRAVPRTSVAVSEETLAKLKSDPNAFPFNAELLQDSTIPLPTGLVVVPDNLKLLPGTPVKLNPVSRIMVDYTVVRADNGQVTVVRDQSPIHEETHSHRKLAIQSSMVEQLSEPDAEQKLAARLKEIQAKNPLARMPSPNSPRPADPARPARTYRITLPVPETHERVTKDTPLEIGTRCSAEWSRRWSLVTVKGLRENGDVEVHWDGWNSIEPVTRDSLTVDKKTLAELEAKRKLDAEAKNKAE